MLPAGAFVEIGRIGSVEPAKSFHFVLDGVAVDDVHDHGDAGLMRRIDQRLEFLGRAEAAAERKEIRHLIAETPVIGMLLQSHDLQRVVTRLDDARQYILAEFREGSHFLLFGTHADVHLVDERIGNLRPAFLPPAVQNSKANKKR